MFRFLWIFGRRGVARAAKWPPQFEQAAKMFGADVRLAKIDTQAHPKVSQTYRVQGIPAFILFHKGREIARFAGLRPAGQLVAEVRSKLPRAQ